jgi:uncharacterized protein
MMQVLRQREWTLRAIRLPALTAFLAISAVFLMLPSSNANAAEAATKVTWRILRGLNYRTGAQTPELKKLNGSVAKIPGFMVPLEDDNEKVSEFLLVPYVGACVHTPPPPPNQIVHVKMAANKKVKVNFWEPIWVEGKLAIGQVKSPYGDVSYSLSGNSVEAYKEP